MDESEMSEVENTPLNNVPVAEIADIGDKEIIIDLDKDTTSFQTPETGKTITIEKVRETSILCPEVKALFEALQRNDKTLPCQLLGELSEDAIPTVNSYLDYLRYFAGKIHKYGMSRDVGSYAFRVAHFVNFDKWKNLAIRLQFGEVLHQVKELLNTNLYVNTENQWGVLSIVDGKYFINDLELKAGDKVSIYTTDERIITGTTFGDHTEVNGSVIQDETIPICYYDKERMKELSVEEMEHREDARVRPEEHLMGTDAWSFLDILFYRIEMEGDEEPLGIESNIFSDYDLSPKIAFDDYLNLIKLLQESDLPGTLNGELIDSVKNYYCKNRHEYHEFSFNIERTLKDITNIVKTVNSDPFIKNSDGEFSHLKGVDKLLRTLDGKSKLVRVTVVTMRGYVVNAVTIDRGLNMARLGELTRLNTEAVLFNAIELADKKKLEPGLFKRLANSLFGPSDNEPVDLDKFEPIKDDIFTAGEIIGYFPNTLKAYYFDQDTTFENDEKFALYYEVKRTFKDVKERNDLV